MTMNGIMMEVYGLNQKYSEHMIQQFEKMNRQQYNLEMKYFGKINYI